MCRCATQRVDTWNWLQASLFVRSAQHCGIGGDASHGVGSSEARGKGTCQVAHGARGVDRKEADDEADETQVRVAVCQLRVTSDKEANVSHARETIAKGASHGAQMVVLPEMWNCPYTNASFPVYAEDIEAGASPSTQMLSAAAAEHKVTIVGGSVPESHRGQLYNTCCVYGPDGTRLAKHRKVHLFDIDIPGKITMRESDTLAPGEHATVVDTPAGKLGIGICYDMRFPELAAISAARGAEVMVYPGAFNMTTGPLHWKLLQQARAVDNQMFVIGCSPARDESASYVAWGHSMVVGPFAEVLVEAEHDESILYADLDFAELNTRRTNMPLEQQRRPDVYRLIDVQANEEA